MGSKYQVKAKASLNSAHSGKSRPKYYDETVIPKKKSAGFAIFAAVLLIVSVSIVGVGNLLDKRAADQLNANPYYTAQTDTTSTQTVVQGAYKTPLTITTIEGEAIKLEDHAGKVVVLYFHFLSCSACKTHSPNLQTAAEQFSSSELLVISITVSPSDTDASLRSWASTNGYGFKLVKDTDYTLGSRFGAQYTPHTIYIGPDGDSSVRHTGAQSAADIKAMIQDLL